MSAQRSALAVVASCCHDIVCVDDFRYIRDSLDMLIARLTQQVSHSLLQTTVIGCVLHTITSGQRILMRGHIAGGGFFMRDNVM